MKNSKPTEFTPERLARSIGIKVGSLQRKMNRMGLKYSRYDVLPEEVVEELVSEYSQPYPQRPDEVVEKAMEIAQQINVQINLSHDGQTSRTSVVRSEDSPPLYLSERTDSYADRQTGPRTDIAPQGKEPDSSQTARTSLVTVLSYTAFIFILLFQMEHVASIGTDVSTFADETARKISGWLFAFTFNLTALVMTIKRGIRAKIRLLGRDMSYILLFALLDVVFFVISSAPIEQQGDGLAWAKAVLVGSATAFVIYSFNELVTDKA